MAPGSILHHINLPTLLFLLCIFISLYHKNTKNIILSYLTLISDREGLDNPFIALVARFLFVCVGARDLSVVSYWIDTVVLKTEGNTYATLLHHPFLFKGNPTQCSRGSTVAWQSLLLALTSIDGHLHSPLISCVNVRLSPYFVFSHNPHHHMLFHL